MNFVAHSLSSLHPTFLRLALHTHSIEHADDRGQCVYGLYSVHCRQLHGTVGTGRQQAVLCTSTQLQLMWVCRGRQASSTAYAAPSRQLQTPWLAHHSLNQPPNPSLARLSLRALQAGQGLKTSLHAPTDGCRLTTPACFAWPACYPPTQVLQQWHEIDGGPRSLRLHCSVKPPKHSRGSEGSSSTKIGQPASCCSQPRTPPAVAAASSVPTAAAAAGAHAHTALVLNTPPNGGIVGMRPVCIARLRLLFGVVACVSKISAHGVASSHVCWHKLGFCMSVAVAGGAAPIHTECALGHIHIQKGLGQ
jgi:hypothetical protein